MKLISIVYTCVYCYMCIFSAFSEYNTEQFTPAKVGDDLVRCVCDVVSSLCLHNVGSKCLCFKHVTC